MYELAFLSAMLRQDENFNHYGFVTGLIEAMGDMAPSSETYRFLSRQFYDFYCDSDG